MLLYCTVICPNIWQVFANYMYLRAHILDLIHALIGEIELIKYRGQMRRLTHQILLQWKQWQRQQQEEEKRTQI